MTEFEKAQIRLECYKIVYRIYEDQNLDDDDSINDATNRLFAFILSAPETSRVDA